ncbi:vanadium-dependent haloperoxidase [Pedobacter sp. L105]|uniref:vanadium-dependent haloperoxidase n=1 Tax=Pedobacter sp. L105 TaxID=1641871 RepID=UPI0015775496|nr:vanadium-dependent haloperoxidase [Pedobacter sp. L105]
MKKINFISATWVICLVISGCHHHQKKISLSNRDIAKVIHQMSDVMIHDVTNPPLAARFFAYTCLSGYEIVSENDKHVKSMHGVLNEYPSISIPEKLGNYDFQLSAVLAMYKTAEKLQPSGSTLMAINEQRFIDSCQKLGVDRETIDSSQHYAQLISKKILAYAKSDHYNRISNYRRYSPTGVPGSWAPTAPSYMVPVEPYFNTVRPLSIDSAGQFVPDAPVPFSTSKGSAFYKYILLSYHKSGNGLTQEERDIANFWDCNPFAVQNNGHMLVGLKKISPGAHWMGIANIACAKTKAGFSQTIRVNTVEAIGLLDAFICCWDDKYRTNRIRPETAIRQYIDPNWKPLLQTPPFPEYISGHSVVSATSSTILTYFFGGNFSYTDNVEQDFGIPTRHFSSFQQAANEAGISRFWGGIHFMDAINHGLIQGHQVGEWVVDKVR